VYEEVLLIVYDRTCWIYSVQGSCSHNVRYNHACWIRSVRGSCSHSVLSFMLDSLCKGKLLSLGIILNLSNVYFSVTFTNCAIFVTNKRKIYGSFPKCEELILLGCIAM
jgi:hypothetical protein